MLTVLALELQAEETMATSSDPVGGVNDAVVIVVAALVVVVAGAEASLAIVPLGSISAAATDP